MIPNIAKWTNRRYGIVNYHLTQFLSRHGSFGAYLYRFKRRETDHCQLCMHAVENVEHAVFECDAWYETWRELEAHIGNEITPDNVVGLMLSSKEHWDKIETTIIKILKTREEVEREKERGRRDR